MVLREFQNSIEESNLKLMRHVIQDMGLEYHFDLGTRYGIVCKQNGAMVSFKGCARNINSLKSIVGYSRVWFEEAETLSQESIDILLPSFREEGTIISFSYNPQYDDDPIEGLRRGLTEEHAHMVFTTWEDNPAMPSTLIIERERCMAQTPELYEWIWGGEYRPASAQNPFGQANLQRAAKAGFNSPEEPDVLHGVDIAYTDNGDWTAMVEVDLEGNVLRSQRFRETDYENRTGRIAEFCANSIYTVVDATDGLGRTTARDLAERWSIPTCQYIFTAKSKDNLVAYTTKRMSEGRVSTYGHKELQAELRMFGQDKNGKYGAMSGHDDLVCALLLANEGLRRRGE